MEETKGYIKKKDYLVGLYFDSTACVYKPMVTYDPLQIESFKFIKLNPLLEWEMRFIKDCETIILESISEIKGINQHMNIKLYTI